jgi:hypothetical protein
MVELIKLNEGLILLFIISVIFTLNVFYLRKNIIHSISVIFLLALYLFKVGNVFLIHFTMSFILLNLFLFGLNRNRNLIYIFGISFLGVGLAMYLIGIPEFPELFVTLAVLQFSLGIFKDLFYEVIYE